MAQSAIAEGTITIKDQANQTQDPAGLKRDTTGTNSQVGNNPNLKNLLDQQADTMAAAQAAGAAIAKTVGDVADSRLKDAQSRFADAQKAFEKDPSADNQAAMESAQADVAGWKEGGSYRAELHMAGGALVAGLGGGSALAGAAAAGLASMAAPTLGEVKQSVSGATGSSAVGNIVANVIAGGIGAIVGGGSGAAVASVVDANTRQLHPDEAKYIKDNAAKYAAQQGISQDQAEAELTRQALRQDDDQWASRYSENTAARDFLASQAGKQGNGFVYFDGKADGSFNDNVKFAGAIANNANERALYDKAWKTSATGQNTKLSGSTLALGDALNDPSHYASNPQDLRDAAVALTQQRAIALQNRDFTTIAYIDDKLSTLRMVAQGGQYDTKTMTSQERIALGFTLDGVGAGAGKAAAQVSAAIDEMKAALAKANAADASAKQRQTDLKARTDDSEQYVQYQKPGTSQFTSSVNSGQWDWPGNLGFTDKPQASIIPVGTILGRQGDPNGSYLAPAGTPLQKLSLAPGSGALDYHTYEVIKPLPSIQGTAAPAFGQPGGGTQILPNLPDRRANVEWLLNNGYLKEVKR
ncbi:TNT domain-containing protein [Cupriavidus pinatubonensis]|uniref:TNT domain-containing protein n=1 Tax=Cupriavidus pinatubonensis TaxID=248026 RepID=UPI00112CA7CA|nr:TNT domain-containing protein [Cupriavidus pinatubonensis]TPQ34681.1 hypothetical protein C2U69_21905 [Cupriavidus pinatubonensis]